MERGDQTVLKVFWQNVENEVRNKHKEQQTCPHVTLGLTKACKYFVRVLFLTKHKVWLWCTPLKCENDKENMLRVRLPYRSASHPLLFLLVILTDELQRGWCSFFHYSVSLLAQSRLDVIWLSTQLYRIIEWFGLHRTFKIVPTLPLERDTSLEQLLKAISSLALNAASEGASTVLLGNQFQCLITLH